MPTEYIAPDERIFDPDFDYETFASQDPEWVSPFKELPRTETSRRGFIKAAIASGTAISAAGYVFRGQRSASAAVIIVLLPLFRASIVPSPIMRYRRERLAE